MILIKGGTRKQRNLAYAAAEFACKQLFPRHSAYEVWVDLKHDTDTALGWCWEEDSRVYRVEINKKLLGDEFLTTIFHEFVHVRQYLKKQFGIGVVSYETHEEYMELPYEKEAYELQEVLLDKWKNNV